MTSDIDIFLANVLENNMSCNLSKNTLEKIKSRLLEKHAKFLPQAIKEFHYLDDVLFEFFGNGKNGIINHFCKDICMVSQSDNSIDVIDDSLKKSILESLSDINKKKILKGTMASQMTLKEMISEMHNVSEKDALSKISDLVTQHLLIPSNTINNRNHDDCIQYRSVIKEINVNMNDDKIDLKIILKENISKSVLLQKIIA